jgi:hypothetical protein
MIEDRADTAFAHFIDSIYKQGRTVNVANQITNRGAGAIMEQSALFDQLPDEWDDLTANVSIGFPILGIKGGKWHYRFRGEETVLLDAQGRFPTPAVAVIILKAQKELSRTYYVNPYVEGVNTPPDCWSSDGVRPDETVANPVNPVCATCPCDAWGSGANASAPKAKACQQRRRTVVTPYSADLTNEMGGGPVLLSVPPGSLTNQVAYGNKLRDNRIHYASAITELSFTQDPNISFPKIEFNYMRKLTDDEARVIIDLREHEQVNRILSTKMVPEEMAAPAAPAEGAAPQAAQGAPPRPAAAAAPRPGVAPRPSMVRPPVPPAQQQPAAAAPPPQQAAPPPPINRVGGFAMQAPSMASATRAAAPPPTPPAAGTIASAMNKPAAPPPTMRGVVKPLPQRQPEEPEPEDGVHADAAGPAPAGEPETTEGALPTDMTQLFNNLMKTG